MRISPRKCFWAFLALALGLALGWITITGLVLFLSGDANASEVLENSQWVASGKYWLDRQACNWLGLCGTMHMLNQHGWTSPHLDAQISASSPGKSAFWHSGTEDPSSWSKDEERLREIPQYVLDHAPYVHLFSGEQFWPCDLGEHLQHTSPYLNYTKIMDISHDQTLENLAELNEYENGEHGKFVFLQSADNVEDRPDWLAGEENIPSMPEQVEEDPDEDVPWPSLEDDLKAFDLQRAKEQALADYLSDRPVDDFSAGGYFADRPASQNGRCGGGSGFSCQKSAYGPCCSIYGFCGGSDAHCGVACDPLSGTCTLNPFHPTGPHEDLRREDAFASAQHKPLPGGRSSAPAILIVVSKGNGVVDAYWFHFYSFNMGQRVANIRFGDHVGDFEHTAIRFRNGRPQAVFLSEHNFGNAYTWKAIEKYIPSNDGSGTMIGTWSNVTSKAIAKRPVVYAALGSHAMYGTPGLHPYALPWGILRDETDRGPLWDPLQNLKSYTYDPSTEVLRASTLNPSAPTGWFHFAGNWGDKYYPLSDPRQYRFAGQYHYVNGPTGPKFKHLDRKEICQSGKHKCVIHDWLGNPGLALKLSPEEGVEEGGLPGGNVTDDVI